MSFLERLHPWKKGLAETSDEVEKASLEKLIELALRRKAEVPGERSFIIRIRHATRTGIIQFDDFFSERGAITLCVFNFERFEDQGKAVFLVFGRGWITDTVSADEADLPQRLDRLYQSLKDALGETDDLRRDGIHVLTSKETKEIMRQQRLSAES